MILCTEQQSLFNFTSFSINVLFFQDLIQVPALHTGVITPSPKSVEVPQSFLIFHDFDTLEEYWSDIL